MDTTELQTPFGKAGLREQVDGALPKGGLAVDFWKAWSGHDLTLQSIQLNAMVRMWENSPY